MIGFIRRLINVYKEQDSVSSEESSEYNNEEEEDITEENITEEGPVCRMSHPAQPHHLSRRPEKHYYQKAPMVCYAGSGSITTKSSDMLYYRCTTCYIEFKKSCYEWPRKMTHPYHPQHPLTLSVRTPQTGMIYECNFHNRYDGKFSGVSIPDPGNIFDNCSWCGDSISNPFFYRCSVCHFSLDAYCSTKFPLPTIKNPKSHQHSLIFLPRPLLLPCDVCGLVKTWLPSYACFQCNFVVRESCVNLPRVIKLTRHNHRLFYINFLSPKTTLCRLCYQTVDVKYGQYFCSNDDCSYVLHSTCATDETIWDVRELEWEPEESEKCEDVEPFKKVGNDLIKYFCHEHHLKLDKYDGVRGADKQCQACTLHIDSRDFYNCVKCDFYLHEVCANLPQKMDHALHNHPLVLDSEPLLEYSFTTCLVCDRKCSGFMYKCTKTGCDDGDRFNRRKFHVDFGCILVPNYFTHKSHEHPLFIPISGPHEQKVWCKGCKGFCAGSHLKCTICSFTISYACATIPYKLHYKYDANLLLTLCYEEVSNETYWCEVCEEKLDPSEWFYTCDKLYTIHRKCAFGHSGYMKPGYTFHYKSSNVEVICNNSNTRPVCLVCRQRCSSSVYFKSTDERCICSLNCLF